MALVPGEQQHSTDNSQRNCEQHDWSDLRYAGQEDEGSTDDEKESNRTFYGDMVQRNPGVNGRARSI